MLVAQDEQQGQSPYGQQYMQPQYQKHQQHPQQYPTHVNSNTKPSTGGFWEYVKNNKVTVIIIVLILIGLIWWFCFKKNNGTTVTTNVSAPGSVPKSNMTIKDQMPKMRNQAY